MKRLKKLLAAVFACSLVLSAMPVNAGQDTSGLADGTAYLNINNADWGEFEAEWTNAEITGDGSYTVSMSAAEPQSLAQFNALEVVNGEAVLGTGCVLTVDSIKINGEEIEMQGPSYTCSADGGGVTTRVNIYNEWNAPDETATAGDDKHIDNRVAEGSVMDATACLFSSDYLTGLQSIEVSFTVTGFGTQAAGSDAPEEEAPAASVDLGGTYNAYIGFQTPKYSFRNGWNDGSYGRDVDGDMDYFNQVTGWDGNDAVVLPGTFTDVVVAGNGTYTVSADGLNFPDGEFADQEYMNLIFLSTDIPNTGEITISDVQLKINGSSVDLMNGPIVSPDDEEYITMLLQNIWNDEVGEIGYYAVPPTSMSITFTVSGFNYDAEAQAEEPTEAPAPADGNDAAPAETTTSNDTEKSSSNVVLIVVIVVVVVAVAACAGVVVAKKKKK